MISSRWLFLFAISFLTKGGRLRRSFRAAGRIIVTSKAKDGDSTVSSTMRWSIAILKVIHDTQ